MTIIFGKTQHIRYSPIKHEFTYPVYMMDIDVTHIKTYKSSLFNIEEADYLHSDTRSIQEKLNELTPQLKQAHRIATIRMISIPKFLQKPFRPITFYLAYSTENVLIGSLIEVTNTYKERHLYVLNGNEGKGMSVKKEFHVSPFFEETGTYHFKINNTSNKLEIHIDYKIDNNRIFYANFIGKKHHFSFIQKLRLLTLWPLTTLLIMPRILYQAAKLHYIKKLPSKTKPVQQKQNSLRQMPLTFLERKVANRLKTLNSKISTNILNHITIHHNWFYRSIALGGEIGLGESYIKEYWDTPNLTHFISLLIQNKNQLESEFSGRFLIRLLNRWEHIRHANTLAHSKENIASHYDLGNNFYHLFLDQTMMYSSAIFSSKTESLKQAQHQKVEALLSPLNLKSHHHLLEIGSGWGHVAITAAKTYGCRVTTITLSQEQFNYVSNLIKQENLSNLIDIKFMDYREINTTFDAIVSIEMIEAVGHRYLSSYFNQCKNALKPGGRFALQAITYPDEGYDRYRKNTDFIRKYIFQGGHLPCLNIIKHHTQDLQKISQTNITLSYAETLRRWRHAFQDNKTLIFGLGFDNAFYRKWIYYFSYCEAAFQTQFLGCYQFVFEKKGNPHD